MSSETGGALRSLGLIASPIVALVVFACAGAPEQVRETVERETQEVAREALVKGPAILCAKFVRFELLEGESVSGFHGGIHAMSWTIESTAGSYVISEGDHLRTPKLGSLVVNSKGMRIYRIRDDRRAYAGTGKTSFSDGKFRALALVRGAALYGNGRDRAILRRLSLSDVEPTDCSMRFDYGWKVILGLPG